MVASSQANVTPRGPHLALVTLQPEHTNQTCNNVLLFVGILQEEGRVQQQNGMVGLVDSIMNYIMIVLGELTDGNAEEEKRNVGHGEESGEQGSSYLRHTYVIFIMDT